MLTLYGAWVRKVGMISEDLMDTAKPKWKRWDLRKDLKEDRIEAFWEAAAGIFLLYRREKRRN